jgi:DNA-binding XRE family transcriptional regulator
MTKKLSKRGLPPMHPGELLREEILPALDRSKAEIARLLGVSRQTLYDVLPETAPLLPVLPGALAESQGFGAPHSDHHDCAGGDANEGEHDDEGDFHGVCLNDLHANWCPVSIRIRRFNAGGLPG